MPNADKEAATPILRQVQHSVAGTPLIGLDQRITLSVGCVIVGPDSGLTDRELVERAAHARGFAKGKRDAVAIIGSELTEAPR